MPAKSKQQQKFMGMVHALNKGEIKPSDVSKSVKDVAKNIKKSDAEDFASTKHSGIPKKVKEQILKAFKEYANKMGGDKLGGSGSHDYAPQKGLRDDDGYEDNEGPKDESVNEAKYKVGDTITVIRKDGKKYKGKVEKLNPLKLRTDSTSTVVLPNPTIKKVVKESVNEGMFSTIDQIRQDSKDVRDFVKNVFKDRDFIKMKNDKEFIKYLKSIYESKGVPQNYMQGRTSDYHTALRGKNRDYSGGTNFKKTNHGQPDIEKAEEDEEVGLTNKQTKIETPKSLSEKFKVAGRPVKINKGKKKNGTDWTVTFKNGKTVPLSDVLSLIKPLPKLTKEEMGNLSSSERIELYKLYSKAMKAMPGSPNQKKIKVLINKLRKKADLKPLPINEGISVFDERHFGKKGIIIMIDDNGKKVSAIFKDKKNADKFNRNKPSDIKKLLQLAKKTKFPKTIDEYGQKLDLSFIDDKEARLKGTPDPKDAIDRNIDEGTMIRLAGQIAQELLPKDTWSRYSNDGRKNKEFVKTIVKDLAQTLNQFYKSHNISVRIKENNIELNEIGLFPIQNYIKGIIPSDFINTTTRDKKERLKSTLRDLKNTLNHFWKQHKIPYRVK